MPTARSIAPDHGKPLSAIRVDRGEGAFVDSSPPAVYKTCVNNGRSRALFLGSRSLTRSCRLYAKSFLAWLLLWMSSFFLKWAIVLHRREMKHCEVVGRSTVGK